MINADRSMGQIFKIESNYYCNAKNPAQLIFDGINYLLIYVTNIESTISNTNGTPETINIEKLVARRISTAGTVIDQSPIIISGNDSFSSVANASIAFDGNRALAVWNVNDDIKAAFIDQAGNVTDDFFIAQNLDQTFSSQPYQYTYDPYVAYADNQYMVIWSQFFFDDTKRISGMPIFGQLLDLSGNKLLSTDIEIRSDSGNNPRYPQVSSDGSNFVVGWIEGKLSEFSQRTGSFSVYAKQISSSGELINSTAGDKGIEIAPKSVNSNSSPSEQASKDFLNLSFNNGKYLFLWSTSSYSLESGVYGVQTSINLDKLTDPTPISGLLKHAINNDQEMPTLVNSSYSDTQNIILWPSRSGEVEAWFINSDYFE
jgi:hypothetical protein